MDITVWACASTGRLRWWRGRIAGIATPPGGGAFRYIGLRTNWAFSWAAQVCWPAVSLGECWLRSPVA